MTLTVETGAVVANAESYVTTAAADTYHAARGNETWTDLDTTEKEQALRKATDYMMQKYRARWKGHRKDATQTLDWPRSYVYLEPFVQGAVGPYPYLVADTIVPTEVKNACAELALRSVSVTLSPDLTRGKQSVTVGPITTVYDKADPQYTRFQAVDAMLRPYLSGSSRNAQLVPT